MSSQSTFDVELSDGRKLSFDLHRITMRQMRSLFKDDTSIETQDAIIGQTVGLTGDEVNDLPYPDHQALIASFLRKAVEPLAIPNSLSASISA